MRCLSPISDGFMLAFHICGTFLSLCFRKKLLNEDSDFRKRLYKLFKENLSVFEDCTFILEEKGVDL